MFNRKHCCVYGCQETEQSNPEFTFSPLPTDTARRHEWLKVIGRSDLINQPQLNPKSFYVCSSHFEDEDLKFTSVLLPDALPHRHLPDTSNIYTPPPKNKDQLLQNNVLVGLQDELTKNMQKLIKDQTIVDQDKNTKNFLLYALNLYLINPHIYHFIRDALNLPSEKLITKMKLSPKLDNVLCLLSSKLKSFPDKAKYCTVCIETASVKNNVYYDILNDELVGLQKIDGIRNGEAASMVYVVMLRSILVKWDQPITYCLLSNVKNVAQLESWIDRIIASLLNIGFEVMALVTNQDSGFEKFATDTKRISPQEHYFVVNKRNIYYIFEFPRLLNCIRNNMVSNDISYKEHRITWQYIETLYRNESKKAHKIIPKIISGHIMPSYITKMTTVKAAAETFSNTVSIAIHAYVDTEKLPEEARETADFCLFLNNLFDVLNSSTYKSNSIYKCALGSNEAQMKLLQEALNVFSNTQWMIAKHKNERVNTKRLNTRDVFPLMQVTFKSVISIAEELNVLGYTRLLTERLNLEPLQKYLDRFIPTNPRNIKGNKPTAIQFGRNFSKHYIKCIISKSSLSNRPNAFQKYFEDATRLSTYKLKDISSESLILLGRGETDYRIQLPDDHPIIYIASYIFYKCHQFHRCDMLDCYASTLPDLEKTKVYNGYNRKAPFYGKLKLLNYNFIRYIEQLELTFRRVFNKGVSSNHPGSQAFSTLRTIPFLNSPCRCFPTTYAVKLLIRLRIYTTIKMYNKQITKTKIPMHLSQFISELNGDLEPIK